MSNYSLQLCWLKRPTALPVAQRVFPSRNRAWLAVVGHVLVTIGITTQIVAAQTPIAPTSCGATITGVTFADQFAGTALDAGRWSITGNGTNGTIAVTPGVAQFNVAGDTLFAQSTTNPIPPMGDFSVYCKGKHYSSSASHGSICEAHHNPWPAAAGLSNDTYWGVYARYGRHGATLVASTGAPGQVLLDYNNPADINSTHEFELCVRGNTVQHFKDGVLIGSGALPVGWVRPTSIAMGNPNSPGPSYTSLETNAIEVRTLSPVNLGTGLVAHYVLSGNANDTGSQANNGAISGSVTFPTSTGANFNPSAGDSSGWIQAAPALNRNTSFTVSAWVKPSYLDPNGANPATIIYERDAAGGDACGANSAPNYGMQFYTGQYSFDISTISSGTCSLSRILAPTVPVLNKWSHVLGIYDQVTGSQRLYVDGALQTQATVGAELRTTSGARFTISRNSPSANQPFHGDISDVRVYDRALFDAEVVALATLNGACGTANGVAAATAPTANLCATGTASTVVTNASNYTWTCSGMNGGTTASCSAPKAIPSAITVSLISNPGVTESVAHGDAHFGDRMDTTPVNSQRLVLACSTTACPWTATVTYGGPLEPPSLLPWVTLAAASGTSTGVTGMSAGGYLDFTIVPWEGTANARTATISVDDGTGVPKTWRVVQNPLSDSDGDNVPDEWEIRGLPLTNSIREALPNANITRKNVWFWIDEMEGLAASVQLKSGAIDRIRRSFERNGYLVTTVRSTEIGFDRVPHNLPVLDGEVVTNSAGEKELAISDAQLSANVDQIKQFNFYKTGVSGLVTKARDKVWRYIVWGDKFKERQADGSDKTLGNSGIAPWRENLAFVASQFDCSDSFIRCGLGNGLVDEIAQSGTLMHEIGHTFALGHGGPMRDAVQNIYFDRSGGYQPHFNKKPNHISVMNYSYQFGGLITNLGSDFIVDFDGEQRPTIDEVNLTGFWAHPVQLSNGTSDTRYGIRHMCSETPLNKQPANLDSVLLRKVAIGGTASCALFTTSTPKSAELDLDGKFAMVEARPEWRNLSLGFGKMSISFLGANAANALSSIDFDAIPLSDRSIKEAPAKFHHFPEDYRHTVYFVTPKLNVLPGTKVTVFLALSNTGFKGDTYSFLATPNAGVSIDPSASLYLYPGETKFLPLALNISPALGNGQKTRVTLQVRSAMVAQSYDSADVEVVVVSDSSQISPVITPSELTRVNEFAITSAIGAAPDVYVESGAVTLTGFNVPLPIQVRGGEMSINGGGWTHYISTVNPGDTLRLRTVSSTVAGEKRTVEVAVGGLVRAFEVTTSLDTDNDGIPDAVEAAGPNNGDANGDGIPDKDQKNVGTIFSPAGNGYVTFEVSGGCTVAEAITAYTESQMAAQDPSWAYPLGLISFRLPCSAATVKLYYHGVSSLNGYTMRRYGPTTPGNSATTSWSTVPGVTYGTTNIGGNAVATASYALRDGQPGDDSGIDGSIIDPVGPALYVGGPVDANGNPIPVPTNERSGLIMLAMMLCIAGGLSYRRHRRRLH